MQGRLLRTATIAVGLFALFPARAVTGAFEPSVVLVPERPRPGDILLITMDSPPEVGAGTVTFTDRTFQGFVSEARFQVYVGIDLDVEPGEYMAEFRFGGESVERKIVVHRREFAIERLTVAKKYTDLDEATLARVEREAVELDRIWATMSPRRLWQHDFVKPTEGALGSPFGLRRFFNGEPRSPHTGVDLKAPMGADVLASNRGTVVLAEELFFTGNTVIVDHGLGLYSIYAHLSRMDVEAGDSVERSTRVGLVGATGRATGPHLHWGVKLGGARVDPATLPGVLL